MFIECCSIMFLNLRDLKVIQCLTAHYQANTETNICITDNKRMTRNHGGDHSLVSRTHLRVSGFHKLVFGIPEHDLDIHTMVLDTHMRVPDIRKSRDDNFWLAFSSSPQFELKIHISTDHEATIEDVTN